MTKFYKKNYPRPQFVRKDWTDLCGEWSFRFDDEKKGFSKGWHKGFDEGKIIVPFTYETKLSGIEDTTHHECVWYSRKFALDGECENLLLHFEGSDYRTTVWINGEQAGVHEGGYARFSFEISQYLVQGENTLAVRCEDSTDRSIPRGKQRWMQENFGCWYVQTTGIWKPVWMENVSEMRLDWVKITPDYDGETVILEYNFNSCSKNAMLETEVSFQGESIAFEALRVDEKSKKSVLDLNSGSAEWGVHKWSPETPDLYDISFRIVENGQEKDFAGSYFGLRKIGIQGNKILLNDTPIYQKLILDQGYWEDSGLTPPSEEALAEDIDKISELGFNGLRKHQKTEDERFLYWCDVKGMLVWSETPAAYVFSDQAVLQFTREWQEILLQNYNHPSVIVWTPFNESWGVPHIKTDVKQQDFVTGIYYLTKAMDKMRPVITNDGWEHTCSDIITIHDYEQCGDKLADILGCSDTLLGSENPKPGGKAAFADGWGYQGQPVIISEYGGIAIEDQGEGWGYGNRVCDEKELIARYDALTKAITGRDYICGYCYTQVTDVEQEVNGLMDMKRNFKCDPKKIYDINNRECI